MPPNEITSTYYIIGFSMGHRTKRRYWNVGATVFLLTIAGCSTQNRHLSQDQLVAAKMISEGKTFGAAKTLYGGDYFIVSCNDPMTNCKSAASQLCQPDTPIKYLGLFESEIPHPWLYGIPIDGRIYGYTKVVCKKREEIP